MVAILRDIHKSEIVYICAKCENEAVKVNDTKKKIAAIVLLAFFPSMKMCQARRMTRVSHVVRGVYSLSVCSAYPLLAQCKRDERHTHTRQQVSLFCDAAAARAASLGNLQEYSKSQLNTLSLFLSDKSEISLSRPP